jgi:hypothetical protein
MSLIDLLPRKPIPFGAKTLYERPERTYGLEQYSRLKRWNLDTKLNQDTMFDGKVSEIQSIVGNKLEPHLEAFSS